MFGFLPQPLLETPDPYGLVLSRAMVSPGGSVRLALNVSESRGTATGRFVIAYAGAGVHHIAFAAATSPPRWRRLTALGAPLLPIPANYYDDLAARLGLEDARLARTGAAEPAVRPRRERRDSSTPTPTRSTTGSSSRSCERRGYQGFGAANAAVRMAAQAARRDTGLATRMALL